MNPIPAWRLKRQIALGRVRLGGRPQKPAHGAVCALEGCGAHLGPLSDDVGRDLFIGGVHKGVACRSCCVEIRARWQSGGAPIADDPLDVAPGLALTGVPLTPTLAKSLYLLSHLE